jgi:hypothetical protein
MPSGLKDLNSRLASHCVCADLYAKNPTRQRDTWGSLPSSVCCLTPVASRTATMAPDKSSSALETTAMGSAPMEASTEAREPVPASRHLPAGMKSAVHGPRAVVHTLPVGLTRSVVRARPPVMRVRAEVVVIHRVAVAVPIPIKRRPVHTPR